MIALEQIREKILPVAREYGIRKLLLIGSHADGTATEDSDLDLVVCDSRASLSSLRFFGFVAQTRKIFSPVDVEVLEDVECGQITWLSGAMREGVVLYDARPETSAKN